MEVITVSLVLVLLSCFHVISGIKVTKWQILENMTDMSCPAMHVAFVKSVNSPFECIAHCSLFDDEECKIASFITSSSTCSVCQTTGLETFPGNEFSNFIRTEPSEYGFLVTGPDGVPDEQLSASSDQNQYHRAVRGRLDTPREMPDGIGGWQRHTADVSPYIQANLGRLRYILGIVTQGRDPIDFLQYVKSYTVSTSQDCGVFGFIRNSDASITIFPGNSDGGTHVTNMLMTPVFAMCVRVHPGLFYNSPTMRFDILGV